MTRNELTDLVLLAQNGDKSALEQIYLLTYNSAYNKIFSAVNNVDEAEDLVHDCFVSVISNLSNLKEPKSFEKWFNAIIFNKIKDYKKKSTPVLLDEQEYNTLSNLHEENTEYIPFEKLERKDNIELTRKLVNELSDKNRQSIEMHYFENKSISEIADELNVSENTVKSRLHNGRNEIKRKAKVNTKKILITILIIVLLASITAFTVSSSGRFFSKILYKFHETFGELIGDPIHLKTAPKYFLDVYTLSYVPEGFELTDSTPSVLTDTTSFYSENYVKGDESIWFQQQTLETREYFSNSQSITSTEIINGFMVMHIKNPDHSFYVWDNSDYIFTMGFSGNFSHEEEIKIIEGVVKSDKVIYDSDGKLAANKEKIELNYPPYSLISVDAPSDTAINELTEIVIKTTSDVTKLRIINQKGDTATFIRSSVNTSWVDNGDGTATWALKYSFTSEGTQEWAVQIRNNTWSAIDEKSKFEITAK